MCTKERRGKGLPHKRGGEAERNFQLNPKGRPIYALKISYLVIFFKILLKVHNFKELKIPGLSSMTLIWPFVIKKAVNLTHFVIHNFLFMLLQ